MSSFSLKKRYSVEIIRDLLYFLSYFGGFHPFCWFHQNLRHLHICEFRLFFVVLLCSFFYLLSVDFSVSVYFPWSSSFRVTIRFPSSLKVLPSYSNTRVYPLNICTPSTPLLYPSELPDPLLDVSGKLLDVCLGREFFEAFQAPGLGLEGLQILE